MPVNPISAETIRKRRWQFGRVDGTVLATCMRFAANGRIIGATHTNESAWRISDAGIDFLDAAGNLTTRFDYVASNPSGMLTLRGHYVGDSSLDVVHVLTELPAPQIGTGPPRIAVLVRTHILTGKLLDLLRILRNGICYDLFVCADETRGPLRLCDENIIGHSVAMCAEIGLLEPPPNINFLWYFGDYAFYCSYYSIPDYDYYVMIEYDVDFVRGNTLALEGLLHRLVGLADSPYDLVATHYGARTPEWEWCLTCEGRFKTVYGILFPFVVLSRRALSYLYDWRRQEAANPPKDGRFVFCEAFVPTVLNAAGGFRCTDVATLLPGCWDPATFRIGTPMLLGNLPGVGRETEFVHPVFSEREYLRRLLDDAQRDNNIAHFLATLSEPGGFSLTPAIRSAFRDEAQRYLSGAAP